MTRERSHTYDVRLTWTGNLGEGTASYERYSRSHTILVEGKPELLGSSDVAFRGDPTLHTPEELLVASLSACHMLWYLHLCADAGITVLEYGDAARGTMIETAGGAGRFRTVVLAPRVVIHGGSDIEAAGRLHDEARSRCFIANSVNFPVTCAPTILFGAAT